MPLKLPWKKPVARVTSEGTRYVDVEQLRTSEEVQRTLRDVANGFPDLAQPGGEGSLAAAKKSAAGPHQAAEE